MRARVALILPIPVLLLLLIPVVIAGYGRHRARDEVARRLPSVLLIGIDTMRADHLGLARRRDVSTPALDALARDGVLFTGARSTAPWTLPSFASVLTGLLPRQHGAIGGDHTWLAARHTTMAEYFQAAGYATTGVVAVDWLTRACNMDQGMRAMQGVEPPRGADRATVETSLAGQWIAQQQDGPFFFFLHYFDVHAPYSPPAPFDGMYADADADAEPVRDAEPVLTMLRSARNRAENRDGPMYDFLEGVTDLDLPIQQYAAGVSFVDHHVGQLMDTLRRLDVYDDMLIVVLADHGEHLGEHDIWFTHQDPYEETLHVPLIIKLPDGRHAGAVVHDAVSLLDVLPTVLAEADLAPDRLLSGRDLHPLMAGRQQGHSLLVAEHGSDGMNCARSLQEGDWKLIHFRDDGVPRDELYDLATDPAELHDQAAARPEVVARLRARLERVGPLDRVLDDFPVGRPRQLDDAAARRLRSLGY